MKKNKRGAPVTTDRTVRHVVYLSPAEDGDLRDDATRAGVSPTTLLRDLWRGSRAADWRPNAAGLARDTLVLRGRLDEAAAAIENAHDALNAVEHAADLVTDEGTRRDGTDRPIGKRVA